MSQGVDGIQAQNKFFACPLNEKNIINEDQQIS
jgi:hypothetical protein